MYWSSPTGPMREIRPHFQGHTPFSVSPHQRSPRYGQFNSWRPPGNVQNHGDEYWCETCDRGFRTREILESHKVQHQKCNIDGCQFIAHPKVITKHIQMQHSTGLFKKIANLNNPDDIKKWREERKKKYPTKDNVEKKKAVIKEKIERGEKMGLSDKHKNDLKTTGKAQKRKFPFGNKKNHDPKRKSTEQVRKENVKRKMPPKKINTLPPKEDKWTLKPFVGIQDLCDSSPEDNNLEDEKLDSLIEDDELSEQLMKVTNTPEVDKPAVCGALSSLMCEYGSSDEDTTDNPISAKQYVSTLETPKQKEETKNLDRSHNSDSKVPNKLNSSKSDLNEVDEDSGPDEVRVEKSIEIVGSTMIQVQSLKKETIRNQAKTRQCHQAKKQIKLKPKLPSTLLQKLLHKEIIQERNIVLQCIRHVIKNNFFDK